MNRVRCVRGLDLPLHDHFANFVRDEHVVAERDLELARIRLPLEACAQKVNRGINSRVQVMRLVRRKEVRP